MYYPLIMTSQPYFNNTSLSMYTMIIIESLPSKCRSLAKKQTKLFVQLSYWRRVDLLFHHVGPEHHAGLEHVVQRAGGPGRVDDGGHGPPVQGDLPDVSLVGEKEGEVALPRLAPRARMRVL